MDQKIFFFVIIALSVGMVSVYGQMSIDTMKVKNTNYSMAYQITNGQVANVTALIDAKSVLILVNGSGNSVLTVTLPRTIIDAKVVKNTTQVGGVHQADLVDSSFIVSTDGVPAQFQESKTNFNRTLTIPFSYSTNPERIQITGTLIVPEFGTIASLVLTISILSIIIVSAKTKLRFINI